MKLTRIVEFERHPGLSIDGFVSSDRYTNMPFVYDDWKNVRGPKPCIFIQGNAIYVLIAIQKLMIYSPCTLTTSQLFHILRQRSGFSKMLLQYKLLGYNENKRHGIQISGLPFYLCLPINPVPKELMFCTISPKRDWRTSQSATVRMTIDCDPVIIEDAGPPIDPSSNEKRIITRTFEIRPVLLNMGIETSERKRTVNLQRSIDIW